MSARPDQQTTDVAIIGAGPAGCVAAKLLADAGHAVTVLEGSRFPRFSIGESLLPYCMNVLERCGLLQTVVEAGFQYKNGAVFERGDACQHIDFRDKFEAGWATTYQVQRARFDQALANTVAASGVDVRFESRVTAARLQRDDCRLDYRDAAGRSATLASRFVIDASGFGRVLPRLLGLDAPVESIPRRALFSHVRLAPAADFDRNKILITVHPQAHDIWYWLIPFNDGSASLGVLFPVDHPLAGAGTDLDTFWSLVNATRIGTLLAGTELLRELGAIQAYSSTSSQVHGDGYALLGNAAGFLDPIFSSGVTIAMKSAELATSTLLRELAGQTVDWQRDYAEPLAAGVETFRAYVDAWYDGRLQTIIFNQPQDAADSQLRRMMVSILAGYAWNTANPLVTHTERYLNMLHELSDQQV
ncbi:flavin-dependent dehydrogenase [Methylohalomonas lacus]|uniref:Flavin-dependent dehydrogenase n=1 Tax=Methylohalomonas lacus TaxID=398773 RepID=A0AAE3HKZ9_9GAMM|nr:NAD(P)/FAD-dependent oxidoreductase [Methylohalomonas lacus]MCS3902357.1 flavin-dependent dehydrogenase [Methylohalomonas lacus]